MGSDEVNLWVKFHSHVIYGMLRPQLRDDVVNFSSQQTPLRNFVW